MYIYICVLAVYMYTYINVRFCDYVRERGGKRGKSKILYCEFIHIYIESVAYTLRSMQVVLSNGKHAAVCCLYLGEEAGQNGYFIIVNTCAICEYMYIHILSMIVVYDNYYR